MAFEQLPHIFKPGDWILLFLIISLRYLFFAGGLGAILKKILLSQRVRLTPEAPWTQKQREIGYGMMAALIFTAVGLLWVEGFKRGWTRIYWDPHEFPWWWIPLSWLILIFLHETYFYWTHRWLHVPWLYKKVHYVHHMSRSPSEWTSFSFHPLESFINALAVPLISLLIPLHWGVLLAHLTLMTITAVTNHLGFEVLPPSWLRFGLTRWLISGSHHGLHHVKVRHNFGLFLRFWDILMKTEYVDP